MDVSIRAIEETDVLRNKGKLYAEDATNVKKHCCIYFDSKKHKTAKMIIMQRSIYGSLTNHHTVNIIKLLMKFQRMQQMSTSINC